jgi:type IV secretion system protein VirD4
MMRPPPQTVAPTTTGDAFPWIVATFGAVVAAAWAGAWLATVANLSPTRPALSTTGEALVRLPSHASDPRAAWPPELSARLPGPWLYWTCQLLVLAVALAVTYGVARIRSGNRGGRLTGVGVTGESGFARLRDLKRLAVRAPEEGRVTVGRFRSRLLACEPQASLAVVGPTGCGKTAGFAVPAILEWRGPVLALSVKADLLDATAKHRRQRGQVWVYDPTNSSAQAPDSWSPIASCTTWPDAMRVAAWMTEAAQPRFDSVSDGDYWYSQARKALAPYLYAAALDGRSVVDLVRWIDSQ